MNEFERKLSQQIFRSPPPDLREAILGQSAAVVVVPPWTWRDWFWPSPLAWGAMAALWMVFSVLGQSGETGRSSKPTAAQQSAFETVTLLSFHNPREIYHVLNFPN